MKVKTLRKRQSAQQNEKLAEIKELVIAHLSDPTAEPIKFPLQKSQLRRETFISFLDRFPDQREASISCLIVEHTKKEQNQPFEKRLIHRKYSYQNPFEKKDFSAEKHWVITNEQFEYNDQIKEILQISRKISLINKFDDISGQESSGLLIQTDGKENSSLFFYDVQHKESF